MNIVEKKEKYLNNITIFIYELLKTGNVLFSEGYHLIYLSLTHTKVYPDEIFHEIEKIFEKYCKEIIMKGKGDKYIIDRIHMIESVCSYASRSILNKNPFTIKKILHNILNRFIKLRHRLLKRLTHISKNHILMNTPDIVNKIIYECYISEKS
jgi:hypothetical protein